MIWWFDEYCYIDDEIIMLNNNILNCVGWFLDDDMSIVW